MKKKFYNVGTLLYVRNEKRTTGLIVGSIVAAVAGLGAAGINAASQSSANSANMQLNRDTLEEQKALFHEANDFNHTEAELARDFNASEAEKARSFEAGQLEKNIKWFEDYNSPSSQVGRYMDAGLNPASLAGNLQQSGGFSIPSGSAASASPASSAGVPSLSTAHVNPVNYGDFAKVLGDAVNTGINASQGYEDTKTKVTFNKYYDALQKAGLDISRNQARVLWNQYNEISQNIEATRESVNKIIEETGLVKKQGQWYDAQGELLREETIAKHIDNIFKSDHWQTIIAREKAQWKLTDLQCDYYVAFIKSEIAKNFGAAAYSDALAGLTAVEKTFKERGMVDELNILRETRNYWEDSNKLLQIDVEVANKTKGKRAQTEVELLEWQNSIWMKGSSFLKNIMQPIAVGAGLYFGAKGVKGSGPIGKGTFVPYKGFIGQ